MSFRIRKRVLWLVTAIAAGMAASPASLRAAEPTAWEAAFRGPPEAARPWVYWFWLNENITREGITADLEAMARAGIGGVLIMEVDQGAPQGNVPFGGPEWRELFKHVCAEAARLGLEVNMNNDAGWCGSGGPWITPELSMQRVVWTETEVAGPRQLDQVLPAAPAVENYYRDIAVMAFPTPSGDARVAGLPLKSAMASDSVSMPAPADWPAAADDAVVARDRIVNLSAKMDAEGRLAWDVPEGKWTILRIGHTSTGRKNHPAPASGCGLECDKLSKEAAEAHFAGLMGKLVADVGPLAGKTLVATHIDSWEVGSQNWTPKFREEFMRLRGYDPLPLLPVMTGFVVDSPEVSERFLWDVRQTVSDLLVANYAGHYRTMAHRHGLKLTIEAYGAPVDELAYGGCADEPMGEFWSWWFPGSGFEISFSCTAMTSAAHVYGNPIIGAEAFTACDTERWLGHPGGIKALGDWAFCEGINRFVFHRYAMQPWLHVKPGMSMGPWGLHYERTQTWWESSKAWHEYLARCQYLLREGLFVADVCYLGPEGSPQSLGMQDRFLVRPRTELAPRDRNRYSHDICPPDALLTRMSVKDGRLVLPDGMSYRLLVLPAAETMTPKLLGKVKELVEAGATVAGPRPVKSPSLADYPACDREVARLANELFGADAPEELAGRRVGKGWVYSCKAFQREADRARTPEASLGAARWIWYPEGNPVAGVAPGACHFRRVVAIDAQSPVKAAKLVMTADNAFTCWINGREAGRGDDHGRVYETDVSELLKPGDNLMAVLATNGGQGPNPAGLIGSLVVEYADGRTQTFGTDGTWQSAKTVADDWTTDAASGNGWAAAKVLGPFGMAPWRGPSQRDLQLFLEEDLVEAVLAKLDVAPDFDFQAQSGARSLRYIHRKADGADVYFVANKLARPESAVCAFRVQGRRPEIWRPDTGQIERPAVYDEADGVTRVPIVFEPAGSVFVVFRAAPAAPSARIASVAIEGKTLLATAWDPDFQLAADGTPRPVEDPGVTLVADAAGRLAIRAERSGTYDVTFADGSAGQIHVDAVPSPIEIDGAWNVKFASGLGAPERVVFDKLVSWSERPEEGVKHFSGTAEYAKTFILDAEKLRRDRRWTLDLGKVEVMAEVTLNGKNLGVLWKTPYRVDVTDALAEGENVLKVKVVNLWINRMIGDESLPDDSDRNPDGTLKSWPKWVLEGKPSPTGRNTFTSWRLWRKGEPLQPSGLMGPVRLVPTAESVGR
ncbi:MAG: hypothetical protein JW809_03315 [Pirellulales bacterium]|nr:hypothetical protein [Pirellulales bacterium]